MSDRRFRNTSAWTKAIRVPHKAFDRGTIEFSGSLLSNIRYVLHQLNPGSESVTIVESCQSCSLVAAEALS